MTAREHPLDTVGMSVNHLSGILGLLNDVIGDDTAELEQTVEVSRKHLARLTYHCTLLLNDVVKELDRLGKEYDISPKPSPKLDAGNQ